MTEPAPKTAPAAKRERRFWITLSEIVGVLALVIAGLNYWDSHREHAAGQKQASAQVQARTALAMTGTAAAGGGRILLQPLNPAQAIQSQRYVFPREVLDHAMEVDAAQPQIDRGWIEPGLRRALAAAHAASGEATLPVGVTTTYVEDGETRSDRSIYQVGYAYRSRFLLGTQVTLQGLSLSRRGLAGNLQAAVDSRWVADKRSLTAR